MDAIILIVIVNVLFRPSLINGQRVGLSLNTTMYDDTDDYSAHIGEDVILTCTGPKKGVAYMSKGSSSSAYQRLVENGEPVEYVTQQKGKYSFQTNGERYRLIIHNLSKDDSSFYWCRFCRPVAFPCTRRVVVFLDVKDKNDDSPIPDFCDLINNTDGIFFTGNDLILRCPKYSFSMKASYGKGNFNDVDFEMEDYGDIFRLLTVKKLTPNFNRTMLSCFNVLNDDVSKDYCRYIPTILVFDNLTIVLSGGERDITSGENVTFFCHSRPFVPLGIEWDVLERNVSFENVSVSETIQGSKILFRNVEFLDSMSSVLTIFCNVTVGSESSFEKASVYPKMSVSGSDKSISPIVAIVIPIIVAISFLGIISLGIVYIKLRKPVTSSEADRRDGDVSQDAVADHIEDNAYDTRNIEERELGLASHHSEVVYNAAYVSYDGAYK